MNAEELRLAVHAHLTRYPMLTSHELARALGVPYPEGGGGGRVKKILAAMEADGEAAREEGTRTATDLRPVTRWRAT